MEWTSPEDVRVEVRKAWERGKMLRARIDGRPIFPMAVRLRGPTRADLADRFDEVRQWIRALEQGSAGYEIGWKELDHRRLGKNRVPVSLVVPTESDALSLIGEVRAAARFDELVAPTLEALPALRPFLAKKPLVVLEHAEAWPRVVAVVAWLCAHPRPGVYLRELDVPGIDTKFVEARRGLLSELLDLALAPEAVDTQASSFEARYGLRPKPIMVRLRVLDPRHTIAGFTDLAVPLTELAARPPGAQRVFITENEINGLAFPAMEDALAIFGLGYGVDTLAQLPWLHEREIHYWGDLDTHGFAMLDRVRASFPHARSLLMDRETLMAHRASWVQEGSGPVRPLPRLLPAERELYDDLIHDRVGERVRLEQERIGYRWVARALRAVGPLPRADWRSMPRP